MDNFLTAVQSVLTSERKNDRDEHLTSIGGSGITHRNESLREKGLRKSAPQNLDTLASRTKSEQCPSQPAEVLPFLRSEPATDLLLQALETLGKQRPFADHDFALSHPGPMQAQIINTLVNNILPTYWWVLKESSGRFRLITCLGNLGGFNAVIARIKYLVGQETAAKDGSKSNAQAIRDLLDVAALLFKGDEALWQIWKPLMECPLNDMKMQMAWKEFVNLVASGKVVGVVAQAEDAIKGDSEPTSDQLWLSKGAEYTQWLGRNVATMTVKSDGCTEAAAQVVSKTLNLGYQIHLIGSFLSAVIRSQSSYAGSLPSTSMLIQKLPAQVRRRFLEYTLRWLSSLVSDTSLSTRKSLASQTKDVRAITALLSNLNRDNAIYQHIAAFISDPALCASISLIGRRACVKLLSSSEGDDLDQLLEKLIQMFGDRIFINHSPVLHQEAIAQTLLLTAGILHRANPMAVLMIARSSHHMHGVSNRLDSSNTRARWLGMVVGTALSSLVDKEDMKMKFETEDMATDETEFYIDLVKVNDQVGNYHDFEALLNRSEELKKSDRRMPMRKSKPVEERPMLNGKPVFGPVRPSQTEVVGAKVSEIFDDGEADQDEGLQPYAKPDSDAEDSEDDATLVNRNKIKAPVYIRDLMSMLRDDKNPEQFQMGTKNAAALIRRKTNFGSEVKDHAEELGSILCNLQDPFSTDNFDELKLQTMVSVLLADLSVMGPWFSQQAFIGEYSIAQRCMILSALGLGGRELAGLKDDDDLNPTLSKTDFPSKRLPSNLAAIYNTGSVSSTKRLERASQSMQDQLLQPMALEAADKSTSHLNAVKIRSFSSRLSSTERTKRKAPPNHFAQTFPKAFFFPLANRYQQEIASYGSSSTFSRVPTVLVTFLRSLALLLHASGPTTLDLSAVTAEFWDLLLSLRTRATQDISVMQAVLFALLTVLEVNAENHSRLVRENPRQLMQTQEWVDLVFERMGGSGANGGFVSESGNEEEVKVRSLAAGVLVKTRAAIELYQRELVGYAFD